MRNLLTLVSPLLGLAVVFWAPAAKAHCPHGNSFTHEHCPSPPESGATLGDLECSTDQIAKYDGTDWVCDVDRGVKFVFVTSTLSDGDLGGLEGADMECNVLAEIAGLPGEFVAWLSTASVDAVERLTGYDGPWFNTNGGFVAASLADLTRGTIRSEVEYDEDGTLIIPGSINDVVWTGTLPDGTGKGAYCGDWISGSAGDTGSIGLTSTTVDGRWTDEDWDNTTPNPACDLDFHIYCFEQ